jgi:hypothetical protein
MLLIKLITEFIEMNFIIYKNKYAAYLIQYRKGLALYCDRDVFVFRGPCSVDAHTAT